MIFGAIALFLYAIRRDSADDEIQVRCRSGSDL